MTTKNRDDQDMPISVVSPVFDTMTHENGFLDGKLDSTHTIVPYPCSRLILLTSGRETFIEELTQIRTKMTHWNLSYKWNCWRHVLINTQDQIDLVQRIKYNTDLESMFDMFAQLYHDNLDHLGPNFEPAVALHMCRDGTDPYTLSSVSPGGVIHVALDELSILPAGLSENVCWNHFIKFFVLDTQFSVPGLAVVHGFSILPRQLKLWIATPSSHYQPDTKAFHKWLSKTVQVDNVWYTSC